MNNRLIIIGAGGHAKVIADMALKGGYDLLGFLDDTKVGKVYGEYAVLGKTSECEKYADEASFVIGIGNNTLRRRIAGEYALRYATVIHPSAQIALGVMLGEGSVVMANAVINSAAAVGKHCIVNTAAVVEHDCCLADFVHVSPHATLCGAVAVGENTHIGAGATVIQLMKISNDAVIGAGAVVVRDVFEPGIYVGVPARKK